jgi:hypothetical protein
MMRRDDWPKKLAEYLRAPGRSSFSWGSNDCVTFAAGAVEAMCDENPLPSGLAWADEESARAALEARGGLRAAVESKLGPPMGNPRFAQRGDVGLVTGPSGTEFLAVHAGEAFVCPTGENRYFKVPPRRVTAVWATGR